MRMPIIDFRFALAKHVSGVASTNARFCRIGRLAGSVRGPVRFSISDVHSMTLHMRQFLSFLDEQVQILVAQQQS